MKRNQFVLLFICFFSAYHLFAATPALNWATYYGGIGNDAAQFVATDHKGNVYIAGNTSSKTGIASPGAFRTTPSSCFIAKFNSLGDRQWATYFGYGLETIRGLAIDNSENVFITGETRTDSGIATKGAYQTSLVSQDFNPIDAFIAKFNDSGNLIWSTYYGQGGNGNPGGGDLPLAVATDFTGNVYIGGHTGSSSGIATSGSFQTAGPHQYSNEIAGFLAKFSTSGQLLWG